MEVDITCTNHMRSANHISSWKVILSSHQVNLLRASRHFEAAISATATEAALLSETVWPFDRDGRMMSSRTCRVTSLRRLSIARVDVHCDAVSKTTDWYRVGPAMLVKKVFDYDRDGN